MSNDIGKATPMTPEQQAAHDKKVNGPRVVWEDGDLRVVLDPKTSAVYHERRIGYDAMGHSIWHHGGRHQFSAGELCEVLAALARTLDSKRTAIADDRLAVVKMLRGMATAHPSTAAEASLLQAADLIMKGQIEWPPRT